MTATEASALSPLPAGRRMHVVRSSWSSWLQVALAERWPELLERVSFAEEPAGAPDHEAVTVAVVTAPHIALLREWQEHVQGGGRDGYEEFLRMRLDDAGPSSPVPAGDPDRCFVVVDDGTDEGLVPRTFEQLLALPDGALQEAIRRPRSLPYVAIEMVRRLELVADEDGWPDHVRRHVVADSVSRALRDRGASNGTAAPLPPWAAQRVHESALRLAEAVGAGTAQVIGVAENLATATESAGSPLPDHMDVDSAVATVVEAVHGALKLESGARRRRRRRPPGDGAPAARTVENTSARDILRVVAHRARRRAGRRVGSERGA